MYIVLKVHKFVSSGDFDNGSIDETVGLLEVCISRRLFQWTFIFSFWGSLQCQLCRYDIWYADNSEENDIMIIVDNYSSEGLSWG
jgi:hypothetical protein